MTLLRLTRKDGTVQRGLKLPLTLRNGAVLEIDTHEAPCLDCSQMVPLQTPAQFRKGHGKVYCQPCFDRMLAATKAGAARPT